MYIPSLSLAETPARRRVSVVRTILAAVMAAVLLSGCAVGQPHSTASKSAATSTTVAPTPSPSTAGAATSSSAATTTVLPDPTVLTRLLKKVTGKGIGTKSMVVLTTDGTVLSDRSGAKALTPASTTKLLTTTAAVDVLGADYHFTTKVVADGGRLTLVGGGDPYLTDAASKKSYQKASLQALAAATVKALKASGRTSVSLRYDTSLFSGPDFNPQWKARWKSYESRVSALLINSGLKNSWLADAHPARTAAQAFAKRLRAAGIKVTSTSSGTADGDASQLAAVSSAPLSTVINHTLKVSDNLAAELIGRRLAIATSHPASFTGAAAAIRQWLTGRSLWTSGMRLYDASGLSRTNRVTATALAKVVGLTLSEQKLASVAVALPVAGSSGTLKHRFNDKQEKSGRGKVHAKTGTLEKVTTLAGYVTTADGATLLFAAMANQVSGLTTGYNWLDRSATVLARCGCR